MSNTLIKDVHTMVDNVVEETDMLAGWSKSLPTFNMSDVDGQRYEDIEYVPEDFRFVAKDGYVSQSDNADAQSLTDRLIPINRNKSFYIKTAITTKELRDPRLRKMAADGFAREIRNKIDTYCYQKTIQKAQMVQELSGSTAVQSDLMNAEVLMMDNGLGMYRKNIFLSLPHYKDLGASLANNPQYAGMPETAYKRGMIPNQVGGFDMAMRADYRLALGATTAAGITVSGEQQHQVTTKDGNDQYIDNRQMTLTVSSTTNVNVGDKFTIDGVNRVNPEVREDTGELLTFTVISVATNGTDMVISPAIITDDATNSSPAYQNASAAAADTAALTFLNVTTDRYPSIFYAEDSIKIIPGNLPVPSDAGGVNKVDATTEQGMPMRFTYWYDPDDEVMYMKVVVFFDLEVWLPNQVGVLI